MNRKYRNLLHLKTNTPIVSQSKLLSNKEYEMPKNQYWDLAHNEQPIITKPKITRNIYTAPSGKRERKDLIDLLTTTNNSEDNSPKILQVITISIIFLTLTLKFLVDNTQILLL